MLRDILDTVTRYVTRYSLGCDVFFLLILYYCLFILCVCVFYLIYVSFFATT